MHIPPDPRLTLDTVRPLIAMARVEGRDIIAVFRCPVTGISEKVVWKQPPLGASAITAQLQATSTLYAMRNQVNGLVRGMLGFGTLGRTARRVADTVLAGSHPHAQLSTAEEEAGIVAAFRSIVGRFDWDGKRWIHREEAPNGLRERILTGPTLSNYDRDITARMVVAIAQVHGGISDDERSHLLEIFGDEVGSLERLLQRPPLTQAELAETTRGAPRRAMLAATWSMALCDEDFDPEEEALLNQFAAGLSIDVEERIQLQTEAQVYVVEHFMEQMFGWGEHDSTARLQLKRLALRIGVSEGMLRRIEARFQKKRLS